MNGERNNNTLLLEKIRLTQYSKGAGCGCKIAPNDLQEILSGSYSSAFNDKLIVSNHTHDDAAVYDLGKDELLISTTDFFTPIVDDAFTFGKIAAANALSDVYAMGGTPLMAIGVLGWPVGKIPNSVAKEVIQGATSICNEANIPLAGGHSIDSPEPFFGLSVNGLVKKNNLKKNNEAKIGDVIYITKPIGSGLLTTGLKRGLISEENYHQLIKVLSHLNKEGSFFGELDYINAMTDITGFGLLGHLLEICKGSGTTAEINVGKIPVMEGAQSLITSFVYPDNTMRNYQSFLPDTRGLNAGNMFLVCDPQTNGGLMVAVKENKTSDFESTCAKNGITVTAIGKMVNGVAGHVTLISE